MRRLLCNQVSVALVGVLLQVIIFHHFHGVDCETITQPGKESALIKKLVPLVATSYKKLSKTLLKTLHELPIDEPILFKKKAEIASDPVVGSAKTDTAVKDYGVEIVDKLHKTGKFVDNFVDGLFFDAEEKIDGGGDPMLGSAKDAGIKEGLGVKFKDRLIKTGKVLDNLVHGFLPDSAKNVDSGADPVVGSARESVVPSSEGKRGYGKRIGHLFDNFMDRFLTYPVDSGKGVGTADDPVVGSAKGAGNQESYARNFEGTLQKTGKLFDHFVGEVLTNSVNPEKEVDDAADPVVGSAKDDISTGTGPKFEHRLRRTGKFVDIFMDGLFGGLDPEDTNPADGGSDPVVGSARDAGGTDDYGGHFEGALYETGKFADMFMNNIISGHAKSAAGSNSVDDPVVGSAQGETPAPSGGIKFEDYLRKTGTFFDRFMHGFLGGLEKAGGKADNNVVDDSLFGSANPNATTEAVSTDVGDVTEDPTTTSGTPTDEELFKDVEGDHPQAKEEKTEQQQKDEELFIDLEDGSVNKLKTDGKGFGSLFAKKPLIPGQPLLKKIKLHFALPIKVINPKLLKPKAKRQFADYRDSFKKVGPLGRRHFIH